MVFRTDAKQEKAQGSSDYFLDSADRIHFFTEVGAAAADGVGLRPSYRSRKAEALNKVGHALHLRDAVFRGYSNSAKLRELVGALGWVSPVVPQSMYIFKQAGIGGEVTSHQDSTFLFTTPRQTCLGLWLALEDATLTNGCLWVRPGSHHEPVRRAFVRQPQPPAAGGAAGGGLLGGLLAALRRLALGSRFDDLFAAGFVPVECRAGDLVCFPGTLDHLSLANSTGKSRHTFQLHLVEGPAAGVEWSPRNWLQYPTGGPPFHALGNLAPLAPLQKA
uniref:Phytanoyl-CoA dioxygenase n=1 Tax=Emiliania huxleyi (strain CCMP1516) TaxID=280463 RepID=A0A0D3L1A7_EMIH1